MREQKSPRTASQKKQKGFLLNPFNFESPPPQPVYGFFNFTGEEYTPPPSGESNDFDLSHATPIPS